MLYNNKILKELSKECNVIQYKDVNGSEDVKKILANIGLPSSVAPYIDFCSDKDGGGKCLLNYINMSNYKDLYDKMELKEIEDDFRKYIKLGTTNDGQIIAIDYNDEIVCINHENLDEEYINLDLDKFLVCIYKYYLFMKSIKNRYKEDVFIEDVVELSDIVKLKNELFNIDETSLNEDSFWNEQILQLTESFNER